MKINHRISTIQAAGGIINIPVSTRTKLTAFRTSATFAFAGQRAFINYRFGGQTTVIMTAITGPGQLAGGSHTIACAIGYTMNVLDVLGFNPVTGDYTIQTNSVVSGPIPDIWFEQTFTVQILVPGGTQPTSVSCVITEDFATQADQRKRHN